MSQFMLVAVILLMPPVWAVAFAWCWKLTRLPAPPLAVCPHGTMWTSSCDPCLRIVVEPEALDPVISQLPPGTPPDLLQRDLRAVE